MIRRAGCKGSERDVGEEGRCEGGGCTVEGVGVEASRDAVMNVSGRGDGASNGDAPGMAKSIQGADRRR